MERNDESVATFLGGGVQHLIAAATLRSGHSWVQLVNTAQLGSKVELLAFAFLKDGFWAQVHCREKIRRFKFYNVKMQKYKMLRLAYILKYGRNYKHIIIII